MNTINWDGFRYFYAAAKSGSLSAAATQLGSNQSTVGRHIDALESSLGKKLFVRSVKGLSLTAEGSAIFEQSQHIQTSINTIGYIAQDVTEGDEVEASGSVRLSLPEGLGQEVLMPMLDDFYQQYPDIKLVFNMSATTANLTQTESDVSVRLFQPEEAGLEMQLLGDMKMGVYASRQFEKNYGFPKRLKDLRAFKVITYGEHLSILPENQWLLNHSDLALRVLSSDSTVTRFKATTSGVGISLQPDVLARTNTNLVRLFKAANLPTHQVWLVYEKNLRLIPRIRAVVDFISTRLSERLAE